MSGLADFLPGLSLLWWHGFFVFLRVAAIVSMLPAFGEQSVPTRVKLVIALAFTAVVAPALPMSPELPQFQTVVWTALTEIVSGLAIGIGVRLFVLGLQTAGSIAAQSTSLSQVLGGAAVDPVPAMGYVLVIAAMALATLTGLHVKAAQLVILSYEFLPVGRFVPGAVISDWGVQQVSRAFSLAFSLAAPFIILSVLYYFALGAINRAMPQLMVAFVGAPLITLGGLALLFVAAPYMLMVWTTALDGFLIAPFGPVR